MWSNAGLSTSILITTLSPANGMVHHTVAKIFVSTKLRDLGPKSSPVRTFWRMVATCICYQPPTVHLLRDLTTFSLASVKSPCVGTGFLGLTYPFLPRKLEALDDRDTPEFPPNPLMCPDDLMDVFLRALVTPLPPMGFLETVQLSLKDGQKLSESTIRRLRRRDSEMRAAAAEGRAPLSEYRKRKQKRLALKAALLQAAQGQLSEKEQFRGPNLSCAAEADSSSRNSPNRDEQEVQAMETVSVRSTTDNQCIGDIAPADEMSTMSEGSKKLEARSTLAAVLRSLGVIDAGAQ